MSFLSTIKLVIRILLARKGRSFLTILGIVIGVSGVIIIIALNNLHCSRLTRLKFCTFADLAKRTTPKYLSNLVPTNTRKNLHVILIATTILVTDVLR